MAAREQQQGRAEGERAAVVPAAPVSDTTAGLVEDTEELLDEIDQVLEEHAEDFVQNYVQKGGQ